MMTRLVLMMNFDNRSSLGENDTFVRDLSMYDNHGEILGAEWTSNGKYGNAMYFNGSGYASIDYSDTLNFTFSDFTVATWVYKTNTGADRTIIGTWFGGGGSWGLYVRGSDEALSFNVETNTVTAIQNNVSSNTDQWYHVVGKREGEYIYLYVDGEMRTSAHVGTQPLRDLEQEIRLARLLSVGAPHIFSGIIDEVMLWNRSLSTQEIEELYTSHLYKFNDTQWYFTANKTGLGVGNYTYYGYAENVVDSNQTETRTLEIIVPDMINECQTISVPGLYQLSNNISSNGTCITIGADDVILDCRGHTITYSTSGLNNTYGVYSVGYDNTTVKNCIINDGNWSGNSSRHGIFFLWGTDYSTIYNNTINVSNGRGIYTQSVSYVNVTGNTVYANNTDAIYASDNPQGTFSDNIAMSTNGRGIFMTVSNHVVIKRNTAYGASHAIHATDSTNLTISDNTANGVGEGVQIQAITNSRIYRNDATGSTGLRVRVNSNNNEIINNTFFGTSYGIYIADSPNNEFINNNYTSDFQAMLIEYDVSGSSFTNGRATVNGSNDRAIFFNYAQDVTFIGFTATATGSGSSAVYNDGGDNILFQDSILSGEEYDVYIEYTATNNTFINTTYNVSKEEVSANGELFRKWWLRANVTNSTGSPVVGALVSTYNNTLGLDDSALTDSNGVVRYAVIEYTNFGGTKYYTNNITVEATKPGYTTNSSSHNLTIETNLDLNFTIDITDGVSTCQVIDSPGYYILTSDVSSDGTCFNITEDDTTLDCQGHTITYSLLGESNTYGVLSQSNDRTTVKNCVINDGNWSGGSGRHGIYFASKFGDTIYNNTINVSNGQGIYMHYARVDANITQNTVFSNASHAVYGLSLRQSFIVNNTFTSASGHGLSVQVGTESLFEKNTLSGSNTGFYLSGLSPGVIIRDNTMQGIGNTGLHMGHIHDSQIYRNNMTGFWEGLNVRLTSSGNTFTNNTIISTRSIGGDAAALRLWGYSVNNVFINNNFSGTYFGLDIYAEASGNTFINNTITSNQTNGRAIQIAVDNNYLFIGNTIVATGSGSRGVNIGSNTNNITFQDSTISGVLYDVAVGVNSFNNVFINTTYDKSKEDVNAAGELFRKWWLRANVTNSTSSPVSVALVSTYNNTGGLDNSALTDTDGIVRYAVTEYKVIGGTKTYQNNITVNATKPGYTTNSSSYNLTNETNLDLELILDITNPTASCGVISSSGYYLMTRDVSDDGTCFYIDAQDVTLDCQGYMITYSLLGANETYGVHSDENNITIKNCIIQDGNWTSTNTARYSIYYPFGRDHGQIINNTINVSDSHGIYTHSSNNMTITGNNVTARDAGVLLQIFSNGVVQNNIVLANRTSGYAFDASISDTLFTDNTLTDTGSGRALGVFGSDNTIARVNATSVVNQAVFLYVSHRNNLSDILATSTNGMGVELQASHNNTLLGVQGVSLTSSGIMLNDNSQNNLLEDSVGVSTSGVGVWLYNNPRNNTLINVDGISSTGRALEIALHSNDNTIIGGTYTSDSTVVWITNAHNNSLSNNTFVSGTMTSRLVHLSTDSENNTFYHNHFTETSEYYVYNEGVGNEFNTTITSVPQGNYYYDIESLDLFDFSGDGWGDGGDDYPVNATTWPGKWFGLGADFGPATTKTEYIEVSFAPPTPDDDDTRMTTDETIINTSIFTNAPLTNFTFNWNGTNYTFYDESLVLMMNFDNRSTLGENDTFVYDASMYARHGTLTNGATWIEGKYENAVFLNGVNDYVLVPHNETLNPGSGSFTVMLWAYFETDDNGKLLGKGNALSANEGYSIYKSLSSGRLTVRAAVTDNSRAREYNGVLPINEWVHITLVIDRDADEVRGYLDGSEDEWIDGGSGSSLSGLGSIDGTQPLRIGTRADLDSGWFFEGRIDELRLYNKALTEEEIQELYKSNLYKYDENQWYFTSNKTGLAVGTYTYQSFAENSVYADSAELRTLHIVDESPPVIVLNNTFVNSSSAHEFNVSAGVFDLNGGDDIVFTSINYDVGSCSYSSNTTIGDYFNVTYACAGPPYVLASVNITFCDAADLCVTTPTSGNAYPNQAPAIPTLLSPANGNASVRTRFVFFNWSSSDSEGDPINFTINITNNGIAPSYLRENLIIDNHTTEEALWTAYEMFTPPYYWRVRACDAWDCSDWSDEWNFTVEDYLAIEIVEDEIDFGSVFTLGSMNDTTDNTPGPFVFRNTGIIFANLTNVSASGPLWDMAPLGTRYWQFKAANVSGMTSFDWLSSVTLWRNVSFMEADETIIGMLNYTDGNDEAAIDVAIEVPGSETVGTKSGTITFTWRAGEE
jgi:parallel beta-helix repeat protein